MDLLKKTHEYIKSGWEKSRVAKESAVDPDMYVAPFTPPCINGPFRALFYWDTYFTDKGLIADGLTDYAKDNADNLLFAADSYGFVPNALTKNLLKFCSQPPYLHYTVADIYEQTGDEAWLKKAYGALKKEYSFWQTERITPVGLNRYYHHHLPQKELCDYYDYVAENRLKIPKDISEKEKALLAHDFIAVAESGMDWTPRFIKGGANFIPIDLNCNLYAMEKRLAEWAKKFEPDKEKDFAAAAEKRKELLKKYCLAKDGLYYDYDYVTNERSIIKCSAQFFPFMAGICSDKRAFNELKTLLGAYGVFCTEKVTDNGVTYQWGYPNSWAPDNFLAYEAAKRCGLKEESRKIAAKYLRTVSEAFSKTGRLWEKYDGENGGVAVVNEYEVPEMLGWTGGVFEFFYKRTVLTDKEDI